jgi:hypothetical protein
MATTEQMEDVPEEASQKRSQSWIQRWNKCIASQGACFEEKQYKFYLTFLL